MKKSLDHQQQQQQQISGQKVYTLGTILFPQQNIK
jgi:hypothetical protein